MSANFNQRALIRDLVSATGRKQVITSVSRKRFFQKGYRSGEGNADAVVLPESLLNLWQILKVCVQHQCIIIMQAANTGLTEGSTPSGDDYDRPVVLISTRRLKQIKLLDSGKRVLCLPGSTLHQLEKALKPLHREPHSVIGSSCLGASVIGGVANNSGGALIHRGPAYTELSLYAQIDEQGELSLVNHLGIDLGESPEAILSQLDNGLFSANIQQDNADKAASDQHYQQRIRDIESAEPARYNGDPRRLYEASGCAGKLAVFAVMLDTFECAQKTQTFYIGCQNAETLTQLRRDVLSQFEHLPVLAEYIHKDAFDLARTYGKDIFIAIQRMGTDKLPQLFGAKSYLTALLNRVPLLPKDVPDKFMQWTSKLFGEHLPEEMLDYHQRYPHHLIVKMADEGIDEMQRYLGELFTHAPTEQDVGDFFLCDEEQSQQAMLHRFAVAGAAVRYHQMHEDICEDVLALDIALPRNAVEWVETLPLDISEHIIAPIYYGHFFCHVFHQDYLLKKGTNADEVKQKLLAYLDSKSVRYPAEHNVGHLYYASEEQKAFFKQLDPTNTFNPGIGKCTRKRHWGGCC